MNKLRRAGAARRDLARVKNVSATPKPFALNVAWEDGRTSMIDFTVLVMRVPAFRLFRSDLTAFRAVSPMPNGEGLEWNNGLSYGSAAICILSDEQKDAE
jgi:hypothetical protein